ncbi:MAG TPA: hypothetical protein VFZ56_01145 [Gemmatimonadaceae bacterium]
MTYRRSLSPVALWLLSLMASARAAPAQDETPPPAQPPPVPLPVYRAPVIALAQPAPGAAVPQDRPVVVFRFAAGEPGDPVDARSFAVTVDGEDRTELFQLSLAEAWGPLASPDDAIEPGSHEVVARICSARGACTATTALVTVGVSGVNTAASSGGKSTRKKRQFLDALLGALRTLLRP